MKRLISLITTFAMIMTLFAGIGPVSAEDSGSITTKVMDYIEFGSYPQTEIVGEASQSGAYGKDWATECDYEINSELYSKLQEDTDWNNNDKVISGVKYHRIKSSDATYSTSGSSYYYNWSDSTSYHYFRYDPIKWRVLDIDGDDAFLLSEVALDDQKYNLSRTGITWEKSTVRSWLNGYGSSENTYGKDYTSSNFIDSAFTEDEQAAIIETTVKNNDNIEYGTEGGNDTTDKVFLLSESEVYGSDAVKYGFSSDCSIYDSARQSKSSTYAKAMGVYSETYSSYLGNCYWWLRSPGNFSSYAAYVNYYGYVGGGGGYVDIDGYALRPALHLNLKSSNLYSTKYRDVEVSASDVTLSQNSFYYDGTAKTPSVSIDNLTEGTDYTVSYSNNKNVGIGVVTIKGIGRCSGAIIKNFEIFNRLLTLNKTAVTIVKGYSYGLTATITPPYEKVIWSSSNSKIATVNSSGKVTAKAAGKAVITAKVDSIVKKCTVTVKTVAKPTQVKGVKVSNISLSSCNISWKKASKAKYYQIYMKTGSGSYKLIKTTSSRSFKMTGLDKGTKYSFKVRAYKKSYNTMIYGNYSSVKTIETTGKNLCAVKDCYKKHISKGEYCDNHTCKESGCMKKNHRAMGVRCSYDYCDDHGCWYALCTNANTGKSHYCSECVCAKSGCNEMGRHNKKAHTYCFNHSCIMRGCYNLKVGENYCSTHKCVVSGCQYGKADGSNYCLVHKCQESGCPYKKYKSYYFCEDHYQCKISSCSNPRYSDYKYCYTHWINYG